MAMIATVVGGSGFVGTHVVRALANAGYTVNVLCRDTIAAEHLKTAGQVGQIVIQYADITQPETLKGKFNGSEVVVNLVSTLVSRGRQSFEKLNVEGAGRVALESKLAGVRALVHISALGVDRDKSSKYAATKLRGEKAVREAFPEATILRPSLVFGQMDGFFERFAKMGMKMPFLPFIGDGSTKFQPVYVRDVADAVVYALSQPDAAGKTYEIVGPKAYSFVELLTLLVQTTRRKLRLISIPFPIAGLMGRIGDCMPVAPMTSDQVKLLKYDNVASGKLPGLEALGIKPAALEPQLPAMLSRYIVR